jgi:hypothetical protein
MATLFVTFVAIAIGLLVFIPEIIALLQG